MNRVEQDYLIAQLDQSELNKFDFVPEEEDDSPLCVLCPHGRSSHIERVEWKDGGYVVASGYCVGCYVAKGPGQSHLYSPICGATDDTSTCELPKGHDYPHKDGGVHWNDQEGRPFAEVLIPRDKVDPNRFEFASEDGCACWLAYVAYALEGGRPPFGVLRWVWDRFDLTFELLVSVACEDNNEARAVELFAEQNIPIRFVDSLEAPQ